MMFIEAETSYKVNMRLKITKSAHSRSFSAIKSAYVNKKITSVTVERLRDMNN